MRSSLVHLSQDTARRRQLSMRSSLVHLSQNTARRRQFSTGHIWSFRHRALPGGVSSARVISAPFVPVHCKEASIQHEVIFGPFVTGHCQEASIQQLHLVFCIYILRVVVVICICLFDCIYSISVHWVYMFINALAHFAGEEKVCGFWVLT